MTNSDSNINQQGLGKVDMEKGQLILPFTQDQFKEFVSGLFGHPEQLERNIYGSFEIELIDIKDIYFLVEERIKQQNKGVLGEFSTRIFYDDDSSILLSGFESLANYVEPRPLVPIRIELSWQYLIKFQDRNVPEKQEIEIYISTRNMRLRQKNSYYSEGFAFMIKYTARTWATDIESMLTGHIKNLIRPNNISNKFTTFISKNDEILGFAVGFILFLFSVLGGFVSTNQFILSRARATNKFLLSNPESNIKFDFLINYLTEGEVARFYFFLTIFLAMMLSASIVIGIFLYRNYIKYSFRKRSYLLLTKKARTQREIELKKNGNKLRNFIFSIVLSISINLLSSYIFIRLTVG